MGFGYCGNCLKMIPDVECGSGFCPYCGSTEVSCTTPTRGTDDDERKG